MMPSTDRTMIAPLLLEFFPDLEKATSDEWHGFLNAKTGLNVPLSEGNATAFDKWRQALAPILDDERIWPYTPSRIQAMQDATAALMAKEQSRLEAQPATLVKLADIAPTKTAADLVSDTKNAFKAAFRI